MRPISRTRFVAALGDGAAFGVTLRWSFEPEPLEAAGGIATALPLLPARTGADRLGRCLHGVRVRVAPAPGRRDGAPAGSGTRPSRARPEPALPPRRRFRAGRRKARARRGPAPDVREHRSLRYPPLRANFRAGRSSSCFPTSNGGLPKAASPAKLSTAPGRTSARRTTSRGSMPRCGSREAMESFVAFRGRPPQLDALLRHNGTVTPA